jgi:hypothetical protein
MSLNKLPTTMPSVEKLLQRVAAAEKSQQKDIRLSIQEARELTTEFGKGFFISKIVKEAVTSLPNEVHGYTTSTAPHNAMFDIRKKLPLFTKSEDSKSLYCAGYYVIRFDKGWVKSFCPKLITLQRYEYQGPFKTEFEMKQVLANVSK